MKTIPTFLIGVALASAAFAQDPSPTPKFTGGHITGDAAAGGPIGNITAAQARDSSYNSSNEAAGSTADSPTPSLSPSITPKETPHQQEH